MIGEPVAVAGSGLFLFDTVFGGNNVIIGFIGDVHGRVFNAIAVAAMWQAVTGRRFDLLVQVGDLGAYPDEKRLDAAGQRHVDLDPGEADFRRLLRAEGKRAALLGKMRGEFASPIYFLRGNHEDFDYLRNLPVEETSGTAPVDPFDLYRFVPDGTVLEFGDTRIAFLGGIETKVPDDRTIETVACESLMALEVASIDILVTHEPPHGVAVGYRGQTQGSQLVIKLIEQLQPAYHVSGHLHHLNGPRTYGRTTSLSLAGLVGSARWEPHDISYRPGCMAILDTDTGALDPVAAEWLTRSHAKGFDPDLWFENFTSR